MKISAIVPTYNRPQALKLCLLSLAQQSTPPHEVLIADDGSGPETRTMVEVMRETLRTAFPVRHVWQEDAGFRKPRILNETVRQSTGDYLVFIDGDCMAHRHYIRSHIEYSDVNAILTGKRVDIGKTLTERLLAEGTVLNSLGMRLLWDSVVGGSRKVDEAVRVTNPALRRLLHRDRITPDGVWGCNLSMHKSLFIGINGCDEDFLDGSAEDNDLGIRALNQGKKIRTLRGIAVIFHLWHQSSWQFGNEKHRQNLEIIKRRIESRETVCRNGYRKL